MDKKNEKKLVVLNILKECASPMSSARITEILNASGYDFSERTVRFYLKQTDSEGLTEAHGRKGRTITPAGQSFLHSFQIRQRTGYLSAKIDQMTYRMDFDLHLRSGRVVVNTSVVDPERLLHASDKICKVFECGYAMGDKMGLLKPGEQIGELTIPEGMVGFCTVCSITLNGIFLKHGVPTASRFGGLLEMREGKPIHFVEMIHYDGTSIDPLEVFIRSGMTNYHGAISNGNGLIGASFREMPAESRGLLLHINERIESLGLGGLITIGLPGQPILEIPVSQGRFGAIVVGGLNPIAIIEESGHRVVSRALSGLLEYNRLFRYEEFPYRLRKIMDG